MENVIPGQVGWLGNLRYPSLPGQPHNRLDLITEYIRIPSMAREIDSPEIFNQASFLRIHHRANDPAQLDAVLIWMPGSRGGCTSADFPAQIVEAAQARGLAVEVWCIDRRENILEDQAGFRQALLTGDSAAAFQYYYGKDALDAKGFLKESAHLGGRGASFTPLTQEDVPFMAEWGLQTSAGDLEAMLNLIPPENRSTNVFLMGHAQGGMFVQIFAGLKLSDLSRGYQNLAGLIFIDSGPTPEPLGINAPWFSVNAYLSEVKKIRAGKAQRFEDNASPDLPGPDTAVALRLMALLAATQPENESPFKLDDGNPAGGPNAAAFRRKLRLSNLARLAFTIDDDPIPGALLQNYAITTAGMRAGRLDFTPLAAEPGLCAEPGPVGMQPPCVPPVSQINPTRVYQWIEGGPGSTSPGILNGYTYVPERPTLTIQGLFAALIGLVVSKTRSEHKPGFTAQFTNPSVQPGCTSAWAQLAALGATRSNTIPITYAYPASGKITIDSGDPDSTMWYLNRRYNADIVLGMLFSKILIKQQGVFIDINKAGVDIPILAYPLEILGPLHGNPFPKAKDFTRIAGSSGVFQTNLAREISPFDPTLNMPAYLQGDFCVADNSLADKVKPGQPGAAILPNTLIDWLQPRVRGGKFAVKEIITRLKDGSK